MPDIDGYVNATGDNVIEVFFIFESHAVGEVISTIARAR